MYYYFVFDIVFILEVDMFFNWYINSFVVFQVIDIVGVYNGMFIGYIFSGFQIYKIFCCVICFVVWYFYQVGDMQLYWYCGFIIGDRGIGICFFNQYGFCKIF